MEGIWVMTLVKDSLQRGELGMSVRAVEVSVSKLKICNKRASQGRWSICVPVGEKGLCIWTSVLFGYSMYRLVGMFVKT